jgi:threonine/homoserine/homoserine lactone efflux protein
VALLLFLLKVFVISFSGAMQPGPVTAAAVTIGTRNRYAGLALAVGHVIIEFPLMVLIMLGMDKLLKSPKTQIVIGLAGGVVLLIMGIRMLTGLKTVNDAQYKTVRDKPVLAGIVLSAGNPYFLLWWATVGLALATNAIEFGIWAFAMFAVVHWLVDCIWFEALSWASFKGSILLGPRGQRKVLLVCSMALLGFGLFFIYNAASGLIELIMA